MCLSAVASYCGLRSDCRSFVEFETAADLRNAVEKLDSREFKGQRVTCVANVSPPTNLFIRMAYSHFARRSLMFLEATGLGLAPLVARIHLSRTMSTAVPPLLVPSVATALRAGNQAIGMVTASAHRLLDVTTTRIEGVVTAPRRAAVPSRIIRPLAATRILTAVASIPNRRT